MNTRFRILCRGCIYITLIALSVPSVTAAQDELPPLTMGVLPYLSTERLFQYFTPMKAYLEAQLKRRIVMNTAPDFRTYVQRAANHEYDIYQTAPHFALLAEVDSGYRRVARMARGLDAGVFVRRDDPATRVEALRGRRVATPNRLALTSVLGEQLLRDHGLEAGRDYTLQDAVSHNNALMRVAQNDADAALTSAAVLEHMPAAVRDQLRLLAPALQVPQLMVMASPKLSVKDYRELLRAMLLFTHDGPGKEFFDVTGYLDIAPITQQDMDQLRPFLAELRNGLK